MTLQQLISYVSTGKDEGLQQMDIRIVIDEDFSDFYVTQTKEVYAYTDEGDADDKINRVRSDLGFKSCKKDFKAGKTNKNGEEVRPDTWKVTAQLTH